ncbi:MAG: alpha-glucosidase C-terminal domain-containing protein, partial [bacterium]|nr:alpha-glucosidase C-terminal domain-containing protein [bacterium]
TMASLAGLEQAIEENDDRLKELALRRMLLLQGISLSIGGIPLLYLGEEWGMLNDYDFIKDPAKAGDTRWIHRPKMQWEYLQELDDRMDSGKVSIRARIYKSTQRLISLRKQLPALAGQQMELIASGNPHVLGYVRIFEGSRLIVLANFSEHPQKIEGNRLRTAGLGRFFQDMIQDVTYPTSEPLPLEPYQLLWLNRA